jgi:gliding motility-associated-like protein
MKKFSSLVILSFITVLLSALVMVAANSTIQLTPLSPTTICATGNDTLLYSVNASNIPANTNVVIYQSTDSTFNPSLGQGDSIGFILGSSIPRDTVNFGSCVKTLGIFIDACGELGTEPQNEYIIVTSGNGIKVSNLSIDFDSANNSSGNNEDNDINTGTNPCAYKVPATSLIAGLRAGSCNASNVIPASPTDSIPANAIILCFTSDSVNVTYNISGLCNLGYPIYVVQSACMRTIGAFTNSNNCSSTLTTRYKKTIVRDKRLNCQDNFVYDRCGIFNLDGTYAIRQQGTDTARVSNNGIRRNAVDSCGGIDYAQLDFSADTTLKFAILTAFCNTGMHYIKAILKPQTQPTTISNTIQFQYICNDVRATSSTTNICSGENAVIDISSTNPNATFSWTTTGGANITGASAGTGSQINQALTYTGTTSSNITYNIVSNDAGCTKNTSVDVVVRNCDTCIIDFPILGNNNLCNNNITVLSVSTSFDSVRWNTGDTTTSINVNQAGNYSVTVYKNNCSESDNVNVTSGILNVGITGDNVLCGGTTGTLTAIGTFDSVRWNTNETTNSINITQQGTYSVIAYINGCSANASFDVARISIDYFLNKKIDSICSGDTAKFILSAGDLGATAVDTFTFTQPGRYLISYQTPNCGLFTDSVVVISKSINNPNITGSLSICSGQSTTLDAGANYDSYAWQPNGETSQTITVNTIGTYTVTVKLGNCSASNSVNVTASTSPTAFTLGNDTAFCGSFTKILSTGNQSTVWSTGVTAAQITITTAGTYYATISNACGIASDTIIITQNLKPIVNLGNDTAFCDGDLILALKTIPVDVRSYLWSTGAQTDTIRISTVGTYSIKVTNISGCSDSDAINITSDCENEIWLPNAFTPDGNGNNDVFYVRGNPSNLLVEKFVIFNRWGNKVFEANNILPNDPTKGWNGFYKDKIDQLEVYGYMVIAKFNNGEKRTLKGNVTLIK